MHVITCRGCGAPLLDSFCDLGTAPFSNDFLRPDDLARPETYYPLHAYVCRACFLVQIEAFETPARHFSDYAYFSSYSTSWLEHSERFAHAAIERFGLSPQSLVVELASNDGYLLQWFKAREIPVLGIEPAANVAAHAIARGIPTEVTFFGEAFAESLVARGSAADLIVANNVLAHVPDLHDFVAGIAMLLKPDAVASLEFPHVLRLIVESQFDQIYHEHFSYYSIIALDPVFARHGLTIIDAQALSTHGGSLRITVGRESKGDDGLRRVEALRDVERAAGLTRIETYLTCTEAARTRRDAFVEFLIDARRAGRRVAGYGAPAKGNTLLNYCGVRGDLIAFTADLNPEKQGRFMPGSRIPIYEPEVIERKKPDIVVILPWNLRDEITEQLAGIRSWGGRFAVALPNLEVF